MRVSCLSDVLEVCFIDGRLRGTETGELSADQAAR